MTTVLVVDDSVLNRELTHDLLRLNGFDVIEAADGPQALAAARRTPPELVVTDVLMPGMDGYELARLLHEEPRTANVPMIFYTGNYNDHELRATAAAFRINRIVIKSSDPQPLLDAIDAVLAENSAASPTDPAPDSHAERDHLNLVNDKLVTTMQRLNDTEHRFQTMVDTAPIGIIVGAADGRADYVNPALSAMAGVSTAALLGHGWLVCLDPRHRGPTLTALLAADSSIVLRHRDLITTVDRQRRWLDVQLRLTDDGDGRLSGFIAIVEDVTTDVEAEQQRKTEEQRRAQEAGWRADQRMEGLRRMAGGAAHDYNNLLAVVLVHGDFLRETIAEASRAGHLDQALAGPMTADLDCILRAGERAAELTKKLLLFGHRGPPSKAAADVNDSLRPAIELLRRTLSNAITVRTEMAAGLPAASMDQANIGQILHHLAGNACDAMPDGGLLKIETAHWTSGTSEIRPSPPIGDGDFVRITVRDTGAGMSAEVAEHAVEPFYTTKPRAQVSGLGLATVHGIANQAGGALIVESSPGTGTSIHVLVPVAETGPPRPVPLNPERTGHENVLVVDDEGPIRDIVHRILTRAGYRVLTAVDATDALDVAHRHPEPIHLLLTDLIMPGMPGTELAHRLSAQRPDLNVLYMSGYAEPLVDSTDTTTLVAKPFSKTELLAAVTASLTRTPGGVPAGHPSE